MAEAQQELRTRLNQITHLAEDQRRLQKALAEKALERDRIMTLFRRGRASLQDTESQLEAIEQEAATIRMSLDAMQAQCDLAEAFEGHYTEATTLLMSLRERLEEIEQTNNQEIKRQVIELLVAGIEAHTELVPGKTRAKQQATITITYTFGPRQEVVSTTGRHITSSIRIVPYPHTIPICPGRLFEQVQTAR